MCFLKWKKKHNQLEKDYIKLWTEYQLLRRKLNNSPYEKEEVITKIEKAEPK